MVITLERAFSYATREPFSTLQQEGSDIPYDPLSNFLRGVSLFQRGEYQEALGVFHQYIEDGYPPYEPWYYTGLCLGLLGKHQQALEAFEEALQYVEGPNTQYNKGVALGRLGNYWEALQAFEQVLRFRPDDPEAWYSKGLALTHLGEYQEALEAYEQAYGFRSKLAHEITSLYKNWAIEVLLYGLNGLVNQKTETLEQAGLKYIDILEKAQQDGMGPVVEDALTQFKGGLKNKKERRAFEELELFITLMRIKNPFEGWRALGNAISKRWPKGLSAVKAVRELRR